MPTLFVVVQTFGHPPSPYDFAIQDAIIADLNAASLGESTGSGGMEGFSCFGYRVSDEAAAREPLTRAMEKHLPGTTYHIRVRGDRGCQIAFDVMSEFSPKRFTLEREDARPLGTFEDLQGLIRRLFPATQFMWTPSGAERIHSCEDNRLPMTPELRKRLEGIHSELEGVAEGEGYHVRFGLGNQEPVWCLEVTPLGRTLDLKRGLAGLESELGTQLRAS